MFTNFYVFTVIHRVSNLEHFQIHLLNFPHGKFLAIFRPLVTPVIFTSRDFLFFWASIFSGICLVSEAVLNDSLCWGWTLWVWIGWDWLCLHFFLVTSRGSQNVSYCVTYYVSYYFRFLMDFFICWHSSKCIIILCISILCWTNGNVEFN